MTMIPYARQTIEDDDVSAVAAALRADFLTTGPAVPAFEAALSRAVAARHAVVCSSGTAALHLAMLTLDLEPGDVAIVPSVTFAATANAVRYVGGEVIFADVDPATGLMGAAELESALVRAGGRRVRAVLPVLLAGQGADPAALAMVARRHGIVVIEDAAHAIGARYAADGGQQRVGACGHSDMSVFSFHPAKTITMGEGGAVTTNDAERAARLTRLRAHGINRDADRFLDRAAALDRSGAANPWYYELEELGFNYRATDIHCALGSSQLKKLDRFVARRAALVARYDALLAGLAPRIRLLGRRPQFMPAWHLYIVRIDFASFGRDRAALMHALKRQGIGTQVHYIPLYRHPYYRARYGEMRLPGAERYYAEALSLPLFAQLQERQQDRIVAALVEALRG